MSSPENTKESPLSEQQPDEKVEEEASLLEVQSVAEAEEAPSPEEKPVEEIMEAPKAPKPKATGDEQISILKHGIYIKSGEHGEVEKAGVKLDISNVSDTTIGSALFEAVFYDKEGNIVDTVEHKIFELKPNITRTIRITSSSPERDKIESYNVRLVKTTMPPVSIVTGNDKITILKHNLSRGDTNLSGVNVVDVVKLAIRNVSDSIIASAIFEAVFYDIEGNITDTIEHKETYLRPRSSRSFLVFTPKTPSTIIKGYNIRVIRTVTADVEKVQVRGHWVRTNAAGEEEVKGTVKNLTNDKADAVLVATFFDSKKENIGSKAIILRDIEPNNIKQFYFRFKPQEGDKVRTYNLNVVCDIEE